MTNINEIIQNSDIQRICNGQTGDCLTVAVALRKKFGGRIELITDTPKEGFNHAVLKRNNKLYDSYGKRTLVDIIAMHIPKEKQREIMDKHIYNINNPEKEFPNAYNDKLEKKIIKQLEK